MKPQRTSYILIGLTIMAIWLLVFAVVIWPIARQIGREMLASPVTLSRLENIPLPANDQIAESLFPPTWTPTVTLTPTPTGTPVPTYPPWATWTPTATFTPKPPTATRRPSEAKKRQAMRRYRRYFKSIAGSYNLDWRLMAEQGYYESGLNPRARGKDLEWGLMQILPSTWYLLAPDLKVNDPYDPYSNILVAAAYLDYTRGECKSIGHPDEGCMLLAYNWGINNVKRHYATGRTWRSAPDRQRRYVLSILRAAGYE